LSPTLYGMRLDGISAYAPEQVWSNARVAARLRLERMRLRAAGDGELSAEEAKLFETGDRWVRRFIGFSERRFCDEGGRCVGSSERSQRLQGGPPRQPHGGQAKGAQ
jgi:hypothetical protein